MNEFIVDRSVKMTPQEVVMGTMGISLDRLVSMILENRDGQFDNLYKSPKIRESAGGAK